MKKYILLLVLVSFLPLIGFLSQGLPLTHDGQDHVARIANFYQSLKEGNLIPRWAANLNWGYGHPILMFLYPLPSYVTSLFHFLGFSLVDSTKIVFSLSFILSGFFMFLWVRDIWGKEAGLIAGMLYLFAPYRFVDLYIRGAIGECWAFVWPPLICWSIWRFYRKNCWRYLIMGSFALMALILSHNALSLMFLPVIFGYMVYLIFLSRKKTRLAVSFSLLVVFGFTFSAFFWLPALIEGRYTLRDIVTKDSIAGFEPFSRLVWSKWNYGGTGSMSVQVGLLQWLMVFLTPFSVGYFLVKKKADWFFLLFLVSCFWLSILLMLPFARPLYLRIEFLQKFQFAWRFLSLSVFLTAVLGGGLTRVFLHKFKKIIICGIILISLYLNKDYWQPKGYLNKPEIFYTEVYPGTTDTGESAPRWSVRFMEKYAPAHLTTIEGEMKIEREKRSSNRHDFQILAVEPSRLVDHTLYFPGWQVLVDGKPLEIEFQDPSWRGQITFKIPEGRHQLTVVFKETRLRWWANFVSFISLVIVLLGVIIRLNGKKS